MVGCLMPQRPQSIFIISQILGSWGQFLGNTRYIIIDVSCSQSFAFNSFWPIDAIWCHISGSTLAQVMAWGHQAITWTNVHLLSVRSSVIHLRTISQEANHFTCQALLFCKLSSWWELCWLLVLAELSTGVQTYDHIPDHDRHIWPGVLSLIDFRLW